MTRIKLCGLSRPCDITAANRLKPEYIGFVFAPKSRRYVSAKKAQALKSLLHPEIKAVGVFVNESVKTVAALLRQGIIDVAQLHGNEDESYIAALRSLTDKPVIKAFRVRTAQDIAAVQSCSADCVLLDSGAGTGTTFDWMLIQHVNRPYFLAGGLDCDNVSAAVKTLRPYAVDVSSGIESDGLKDEIKMAAFIAAVRKDSSI